MLSNPKKPLPFFILATLLAYVVPLTLKNSGYEIYDLESNSTNFINETSNWMVTPLDASATSKYSKCGSTYLLGGYMVLQNYGHFIRTYKNLPPHNSVNIFITFWFIDRWEPQDNVKVTIRNGVSQSFTADALKLDSAQTNWVNSVCGTGSKDLIEVTLMMRSYHTYTDLELTVTTSVSNWNPNRGFSGIRDVKIISSLQTFSSLSSCSYSTPSSLGTGYACGCPEGKISNGSSCISCHASCETCSGPTADQCVSCQPNFIYNGTQCLPCDSTCQTCLGTGPDKCLSCKPGDYLYPNSSCLDHCNQPYSVQTSNGISYCKLNCTAPQYFYTNESCLDTCNSPFYSTPTGSSLSCTFPCAQDYYYKNDSCQSTCDAAYRVRNEGGYKYCEYPCQAKEYLYNNNGSAVCLNKCDPPLIAQENNGNNICRSPCETQEMYYIPSTNTCQSACESPYTVKQYQYHQECIFIESPKQTPPIETVTIITDKLGGSSIALTSIASSGKPTGALMGALAKMFSYIKYLEIIYSSQLQGVLDTFSTSFVPFGIDLGPPSTVKNETLYNPIPPVFSQWNIHPSFLVNFWKDILLFSLILSAFTIIRISERGLKNVKKKKLEKLYPFCLEARLGIQNFMLSYVYESYGDVIFFGMLEFQSVSSTSGVVYLGLFITVLFIVGGLALFGVNVWLIRKYQALNRKGNRKDTSELEQFLEKYKGMAMLFKEFKDESMLQQACLLFFTLRDLLFNLIFTVLFEHPLEQVVVIILINIVMLAYLLIKRPIKDFIDQVFQIIGEFLLFIVNASLLIMCILDRKGLEATGARDSLGKAIIGVNIIFKTLTFLCIAIKVYRALKQMYEERKEKKKKIAVEGSSTSRLNLDNMTSIPSEMNQLDPSPTIVGKLEPNDLTFEASVPKDHQVFENNKFGRYLGNGAEMNSIIFHSEWKHEGEETQRALGGSISSPNTLRNNVEEKKKIPKGLSHSVIEDTIDLTKVHIEVNENPSKEK